MVTSIIALIIFFGGLLVCLISNIVEERKEVLK